MKMLTFGKLFFFNDFLGIGAAIKHAFLTLVWDIFVQGPLVIINLFTKRGGIIYYLSTDAIFDIIFQTDKNHFSWESLPRLFFVFSAVGGSFIIVCLIIQLIITQLTDFQTMKEKFIFALRNSLKSVFIIFSIPIFFWMLNKLISEMTIFIFGMEGDDSSLADQICGIGAPNKWSVTPGDYSSPSDIEDWNLFLNICSAIFMVICCAIIGFMLVQRMIEIFFLLVISPFVASVMPLDGGKRLFQWKDIVIGKFFSSLGVVVSFVVFIKIIPRTIEAIDRMGYDWLFRSLIMFIIIAAGGITVIYSQSMVSSLIGEGMGISEGLNTARKIKGLLSLGKKAGSLGVKSLGILGGMKSSSSYNERGAEDEGGEDEQSMSSDGSSGYSSLSKAWGRRGIPGVLGASVMNAATWSSKRIGNISGNFKMLSKDPKNMAKTRVKNYYNRIKTDLKQKTVSKIVNPYKKSKLKAQRKYKS